MTKRFKVEVLSDISDAKIKTEIINKINKNTKDFRIAYIKRVYSDKNIYD